MSFKGNQTCPGRGLWVCRLLFRAHGRASLILLALLLALGTARAESSDDQYIRIVGVIEQADSLVAKTQAGPARAKYEEARNALLSLKQNDPSWNAKLVSYRLNYVTRKIVALSEPAGPASSTGVVAGATGGNVKAKASQTSAAMSVKLLEAGAEPRRVLRFHAKAGEKQTVEMMIKTSMGMDAGPAAGEPMKMPAMKMTLGVVAKDVSPDGDISYEMRIDDAGMADESGTASPMAEVMKAAMQGAKGLTLLCTKSDRGLSKKTEARIPAGADAMARQSMEQMKDSFSNSMFPLPEEAVGVGAKWESTQKAKGQGVVIDQTTTCELVSLEGEVLILKSSIVQSAPAQKIQNPAMPQVKMDLTKMTGSGRADCTIDLAKIMPSEMTAETHTESTMAINAGNQKQTMVMKQDTSVRFESK